MKCCVPYIVSDGEEACAPELGAKEQGSVSVVSTALLQQLDAKWERQFAELKATLLSQHKQRKDRGTPPLSGNLGQLTHIHRHTNRIMGNKHQKELNLMGRLV